MCLDKRCKYISIIIDDDTGKRCYIHYAIREDGVFEEIMVAGDVSIKNLAEEKGLEPSMNVIRMPYYNYTDEEENEFNRVCNSPCCTPPPSPCAFSLSSFKEDIDLTKEIIDLAEIP